MRTFKAKITSMGIAILLALLCVFPSMAENGQVLSLGRVAVTMPKITAEVKGQGYDEKDITAKLGTEALKVESAEKYGEEHTTCAYILIDLSGSVDSSFALIKENIISYVEGMGKNDKVVILTFGTTEVTSILKGDESIEEIKDKVNILECDEQGTVFYEALAKAYQLSNASASQFDREYVIAFSDGIDEQKGNTTYEEIKEFYNTRTLPIYAACTPNASQEAADKFGQLARTSGGSIKIIDDKQDFEELTEEMADVTLVTLHATGNVADGTTKPFVIKIGDLQAECNVPVTKSLEDSEAPTVNEVKYMPESNLIVVDFSEPVSGASAISSYIIKSGEEQVGISSIEVTNSQMRVEIKLKDGIQDGTYSISFKGITDCSNEKNILQVEENITIKGVPNKETMPLWLIIALIVAILIVIAVLIIVIVVITKKKTTNDSEENLIPQRVGERIMEYDAPIAMREKHHIKAENVIRIRLRIKTGRMSEQNIETNLVSSLIVGRSNTCDVYIDDTKLSRQHFVIEHDSGVLYVMDLQSSNGTKLNGIQISSRQVLHSGDKIVAGLSDIYITILE